METCGQNEHCGGITWAKVENILWRNLRHYGQDGNIVDRTYRRTECNQCRQNGNIVDRMKTFLKIGIQ
jgi:hypothetical protein